MDGNAQICFISITPTTWNNSINSELLEHVQGRNHICREFHFILCRFVILILKQTPRIKHP